MPATKQDLRDRVINALKIHAGLSDERIERFKHLVVSSGYLHEHGHGAIVPQGHKYYKQDGSEYTLGDVPPQTVVDAVRAHIRNFIFPHDRCTEVYDKVMASVPSKYRPKPKRDEPPPDPNGKPQTPFSESRARTRSKKSNAKLIDDLASAAGLSRKVALSIRGQITWWDGMGGAKSCMLTTGTWKVSGGRLGVDHTLEFVPNCYVRDRIMDYINTMVDVEKRQAARSAVFSDLTEAEIDSYSALIAKMREEADAEAENPPPIAPAPTPPVNPEYEAARQHHCLTRDLGIMKNLERQEELLRAIDDTVDLTPGPAITSREADRAPWISRSVVKPGSGPLPAERGMEVESDICHDCDQVRAMIKRFVGEGEWTLDQFRLALGGVARPQLIAFLELVGPQSGIRGKVFQLCWEFFRRREKLGLPLVGAGPRRDEDLLQQRGAKRRSLHGGDESRNRKHPRTNRI